MPSKLGGRRLSTTPALIAGLVAVSFAATVLHAQLPAGNRPSLPWVRIPAGMFQMGCVSTDTRCEADERPPHTVTLDRPFDLMATEVTVSMYRAISPSMREQPPWSTTEDHPVTLVSWDDARRFCEAVAGRLPTEAEWEYAARGGHEGTIYPWGDQAPSDRAGAPGGVAFESDAARAARSFAANGFGLYDMAGNAWEWVADWYGRYDPDPVTNPQGPLMGTARVVRGGSYGDDSVNLRISNRSANLPRNNNLNIGFRCARD